MKDEDEKAAVAGVANKAQSAIYSAVDLTCSPAHIVTHSFIRRPINNVVYAADIPVPPPPS